MARQMAQPTGQSRHGDAAAIERVLKAERDGVSALQQGAKEAEQLLSRARAEAGDIARRTDSLISKLHAAYLQKIQTDLQQFASGEPLDSEQPSDANALAETARRVAARLTGGS